MRKIIYIPALHTKIDRESLAKDYSKVEKYAEQEKIGIEIEKDSQAY